MILCTKMNGNGNDFLVINNMELKYSRETLSMYAKALCRRRESLGADGILAAEPSEAHDFKMRLFNRDGTRFAVLEADGSINEDPGFKIRP